MPTLRAGARISPKKLLKSSYRSLRKLGSEWMGYRYGVMPLVYSYRDAQKLLRRGKATYNRKVRKVYPVSSGVTFPPNTTTYLWSEVVGDITFRAQVFQYFRWVEAARFAGLGMNPLRTAWELIPYSFVVDWFVNVGDYITRRTSQPLSTMSWACISRRSSYTKQYWVHYKNEDKTVTFANRLPTGWIGGTPPATPSRVISRPEENQLYKQEEVQSYERTLFPLSGAQLSYKPSLNWKRGVDSAVMANNQLRGVIRLFKGS